MTNHSLTIRRATANDARLLAELNRFVHDIHVEARPDNFRNTDIKSLTLWFRKLLQEEGVIFWISENARRATGYVSSARHERPANALCKARQWIEIDNIAVDPTCRRQGIGRALLEKVFVNASNSGITDIELTSWDFNRQAHAFFERAGFRPKRIRFARRGDETLETPSPHHQR